MEVGGARNLLHGGGCDGTINPVDCAGPLMLTAGSDDMAWLGASTAGRLGYSAPMAGVFAPGIGMPRSDTGVAGCRANLLAASAVDVCATVLPVVSEGVPEVGVDKLFPGSIARGRMAA